MMDSIFKRYIVLISTVMLIWYKELTRAQICSKSKDTMNVVQKCPANREEWKRASKNKECSEIRKYDSCRNVEYHCLVNEFRNETVEVCTDSWFLQGYCPIYLENEVRNDYTKVCMNFANSCKCSNRYLSTEAYKWQCCYDLHRTIRISTGNQNATVTYSDKYRNLYTLTVAIWTLLALILLLMVLCVFGFVYQRRLECLDVCIRSPRINTEGTENGEDKPIPNETPQDETIGNRVKDLEECLDLLKKEIDQILGNDILDLEYKLRSTDMKVTNMYTTLFVNTGSASPVLSQANKLEARVTELSTNINQMRQKLTDLGLSVIHDNMKQHASKSHCSHYNKQQTTEPKADSEAVAVKVQNRAEDKNVTSLSNEESNCKNGYCSLSNMMKDATVKDDINQETEEDHLRVPAIQQARLSKNIILVDDPNGACLADEMGSLFEKKTFREKTVYLRDEIEKLMENFGRLRDAYYGNAKIGNFQILEDRLSNTEAEIHILSELYGFTEIQGSLSGKCPEEKLEEMKSSFEQLKKTYELMECKIGKQ